MGLIGWRRTKIKTLWEELGGLASPSKMPGYAWGIPASRCLLGSKLQPVKGAVCNVCYATRGRYNFLSVKDAYERRYQAWLHMETGEWVEKMASLISLLHSKEKPGMVHYFRWFDSGDLQNEVMLRQIIDVSRHLGGVEQFRFWLPTREHMIVYNVLSEGVVVPSNLTIRLSAHMIGSQLTMRREPFERNGVRASGVDLPGGLGCFVCPAKSQGNSCGDCRACWSQDVAQVSYPKH